MKADGSLLFGALLACSCSAFGQGSVVFGGGPSFSTVSTDFEFYADNSDFATGVNFGAGYRHRLGPHFSLQALFKSERKGFEVSDDFVFTDVNGNELGTQPMELTFRYDYLSLPLAVHWNTTGKTYAIAMAGLVPSLLNTAKMRQSAFHDLNSGNELFPAKETDLSAEYNQWDLSALAGLGAGHLFGERWRIELTAEYAHGFLDMGNEKILQDRYLLNRSVALLVSVIFEMKPRSKGASVDGK